MTTPQSRQTAREKWATLMTTALVTGGIVDAVYSYQRMDLKGLASVLIVTSNGTDWSNPGNDPVPVSTQFFAFHMFVRYAQDTWTEEDSENFLDTFEQQVSVVVIENSQRQDEEDPEWTRAWFDKTSEPDVFVDIEGHEYRHEVIRVACEVYNIG